MTRSLTKILLTGSIATCLLSCNEKQKTKETVPPNIIYILADDLGYGEVGAYGQKKIETPNIDALASKGMLFTQHYTGAPVCAPARYSLLTGKHMGHSYIRGNDEWGERGDVKNYLATIRDSTLEGQRPMPLNTATIAHMLKEAGYTTGMVGKWGLGAPHTESVPNNMGFDYFYGFNCQRQAHTYYPVHLYENKERVYLSNDTVPPHTGLPENVDPNKEGSYAMYTSNDYAPELMFNKVSAFVKQNKDRPFFMYWADPVPHVPLQVPKRWVDHYIQKFGEEKPYTGDKGYFPNKNPRATYAAMVSYFDENIGKLIAQLKQEGLYQKTIIIFTSDNGPTFNGGSDSEWFESAGPYSSIRGRGKGFLYEGGIRIPMIASWPGNIKAGTKTDLPSAQYDVMATLCELTGQAPPRETDGISFLPTLLGKENEQQKHDFLFWEYPEYGGQVAIRMGDWKILRRDLMDAEKATLELYNLKTDPREEHNVAGQHSEIVKKAEAIFKEQHSDAEIKKFRIPLIESGLLNKTEYASSNDL
ncbi:arylsulfatase [Sinomicrobium weinanense]|uniref:Arylsulfatase n=1 Tax=Sinomicrobium weinanense TaxID=2842200 RepID=A0A926JTL5_9FLAO|nr:arylsulfatase [Sinomicrobium weinanense]MBC9797084.1 arylsulfatase [Sinomicrobium weinanense]MBU3122687.1 arylsulfatase [Sinomicrobium weinanense]